MPVRARPGHIAATGAAVGVLALGATIVQLTGAAAPVRYEQPAAARGAEVDQGYLRTKVLDVAVRMRTVGAFDVRQRALEVSLETTNTDTRTASLTRVQDSLVLKHPNAWKPQPAKIWAQAPGGGETQLLQPGRRTRVTLAYTIPDGPPPPSLGVVLIAFEKAPDFFYGHQVWKEAVDEEHGIPDAKGKPTFGVAAVVTLPVRTAR